MVTEIWCVKEIYIAGQALGAPYQKCISLEGGLQSVCHLATDNALRAGFFYGLGWSLFMIGFVGISLILVKRGFDKWLKRKTQIALQESMRRTETFTGLAKVKAEIESKGIYEKPSDEGPKKDKEKENEEKCL